MKNIAILTINDDGNYGNRLQNYATQQYIKKYKMNVMTICNLENQTNKKYLIKILKKMFKKVFSFTERFKKYSRFKEFNKNIQYFNYYIDNNHIPKKLGEKFDYFIVGSDQVWNPDFGRMSDIDFLTFAPKEKRNSFSASFGISEIPDNLKEYYKKNLLQLNNISVREERGKEIIEELAGRTDVEVLVDPTMLLTAEEWDKVSKKPKQLKFDKYILNYFLGDLSKKRKKEIERVAKENDCEIINILDKDGEFYATGPSEFLYLEKNAFLICTDSFHSSVFSIIYNRPFIVFEREDKNVNMNSRIETLLSKFDLQDRIYIDRIDNKMLEHDYTNAYKILEKEKEKSDRFLRKALDIEEI